MSSSGGGGGGGWSGDRDVVRVSIPSNVRKIIQSIKEITGNHSEEDIYAMLKECSMDPNETTQKLLLQDTFHEVRRKRDRKKENLNKEPADSRWKSGVQGRGNRGRGTHSSRNISHDKAAGARKLASAKDNESNLDLDKGVSMSSLNTPWESEGKEPNSAASSLGATANGPTAIVSRNLTVMHDNEKLEEHLGPSATASENRDQFAEQMPDSSNFSTSMSSSQPSGAYFLSSDPVSLSLQDSRQSSAVGTMKHGVGIQSSAVEQISAVSEIASGLDESGNSNVHGKMPSKAHGNGKNQHLDSSHTAASAVSRPSSNYSNRSQVIGPQKVGPNKEWKPKSTIPSLSQGSGTLASSEAPALSVEASTKMATALNDLDSKEANVRLQRKFEELHVSDGQHVIIPHHLHVPEAEKLGFCFGSFDTSFGISTSSINAPENDHSASSSETSDGNEAAEEQFSSNQNAFVAVEEGNSPENNHSSTDALENLSSGEGGVSSSNALDYDESKQESTPGGNQYTASHTTPNYSFGFMPPIVRSQLAPFESSESQTRDVSRLPAFVVQPTIDPTSYYAQFYRSGADSDGRISPFHPAGVASKYSGNFAMLSPQTSQSPQEPSNPLVLSTATPTPLITQAAGVMQSSIAATQQPVSVFRPPAGLHLPHYPSNYVPYGHYISPFYVPPAIHQFISNGAFPQQPQGSNLYPAPPAAAAKYPLPQYKPGTNPNNSSHVGIPGSYMPYGSSMANYNPNAASATGNSTTNEDLATSHLKENSLYESSQQSEGSGVWIAPPGRDFSSLQASSFYNFPQGQVAFAPAQPGHGTFAGIYHPAQPVNATTVNPLLQQSQTMASPLDVVGPTASAYQQPQHSQMNWPNNF
ncbi:uncharacterized protein [Coffea arabica]|uniref:Uncharacterized protein isoform X1 n=1 Tax=Coffea arabica TaxID=13443 RepID=A0A6P6SDA4_COFAR|nr:GBF-interacting protein 1-like isoform X1 [Coffea arabica]